MRKHVLPCMSTDGCTAFFLDIEMAKCLSAKTLETLHKIKQEKEIDAAELEGLEKCPCVLSLLSEARLPLTLYATQVLPLRHDHREPGRAVVPLSARGLPRRELQAVQEGAARHYPQPSSVLTCCSIAEGPPSEDVCRSRRGRQAQLGPPGRGGDVGRPDPSVSQARLRRALYKGFRM